VKPALLDWTCIVGTLPDSLELPAVATVIRPEADVWRAVPPDLFAGPKTARRQFSLKPIDHFPMTAPVNSPLPISFADRAVLDTSKDLVADVSDEDLVDMTGSPNTRD
jgi:hypothetical protein